MHVFEFDTCWNEKSEQISRNIFEHSLNVFFFFLSLLSIDLMQTGWILACINELSIRPLILLCNVYIFRNTIVLRNSLGFRYVKYWVECSWAWHVSPKWNRFSPDHSNCQNHIYELHTFVWHSFQNDVNLLIFIFVS